ncbi:CBS domain-containing protein [Schlegelella aquatica]|uniref:CBS domain-containing protein n=1 Tax=Caldimonas aquatica TaxID=376175 RepID=UPI003752ABA3
MSPVPVSKLMTREVHTVLPADSLQEAAAAMERYDVGALPVCEVSRRLVGIITDRDITVRAAACGLEAATTTVAQVMTEQVRWCLQDEPVEDVAQRMSQVRIRRLPVLDRRERLVGIVTLADLARQPDCDIAPVLAEISSPCEPDRLPPQSTH